MALAIIHGTFRAFILFAISTVSTFLAKVARWGDDIHWQPLV